MSDETPLSRWLQEVFLAEERCLSGEPCGSSECAACIYGEGVQQRTLMPAAWAGLEPWEFAPRDFGTPALTVCPDAGGNSFGAAE